MLVAVIGATIYFNRQDAGLQAQDAGIVAAQQDARQGVMSDKNYTTFTSNQQKLSQLKTLLAGHLTWVQLLPKFASATLKTATFSSFQATSDGGVDIAGSVPSFVELDKMMQAFQLPDFSSYIKTVSLVNVGLAHSDKGNGITFTVHITFDPSILNYAKQNQKQAQ